MTPRTKKFAIGILAMFISFGLQAAFSSPMDRLISLPFHTISFGDATLEMSLSADRDLVLLFLQNGSSVSGVKAVIENDTLPFTALYITRDDRAYLSFSDKLIIASCEPLSLTLVPDWTAADMYLSNGMLYAELAFTQPYGEGLDIQTLRRTAVYRKVRPFDVQKAVKAQSLK